uniref:Uncharacterized protein n=1 Tax=Anguilla anguilla TaxID=7936 RepID=A0A0E9XRB7_ANGAN
MCSLCQHFIHIFSTILACPFCPLQ